jgi:3-oxoacyl-[acyl-carrier-protein] synthase II
MKRRVVVTGMGVVSSVGIGVDAFGRALRAGVSGASDITVLDTNGFASHRGCELKGFDGRRWVKRLDPARPGRSSQFAIAAARMAIEDAGLEERWLERQGCGVSVGTTEGESQEIDQLTEVWVRQGPERMSADQLKRATADLLSVSVCQELGLHGEALTISTACAAGNYAIGYAYDLIRLGEADCMLCGGADSMSRKSFSGFYRLGAIAPRACQPFDKNRRGILTGEGAGMLLLESLEGARARGAAIHGEVLGYGLTCDANHPVAPDRKSIADCIRLAHRNAGIRPGDVDYISAHGTGTQANDQTETAAIREVFGPAAPPTSSIKSMLGHTMGAASALSSVACAIAMKHGFIPPTINHDEADPNCPIDCVPNQARAADLRIVQNNAFAFFGNNAILIMKRYEN